MSKKIKVQAPKGMHDILPINQPHWQYLIKTFEEIAFFSGYSRIDTPMVEAEDLYVRTAGETSDIVSKEMYYLEKKKEVSEKLVLRPEFTAGIVRAYVQHGLKNLPKPIKLYTHGAVFRYNKPQAGRVREFHQLDLEQIGMQSSSADAEIISLVWQLFSKLGLKDVNLHINTIGNSTSRKKLVSLLVDYFTPYKNQLCEDCLQRLKKNPLRILDCKEKNCQKIAAEAPQLIDNIDDEAKKHFYELLEYLDELDIPYILNPKLVRGLDYYTKTVFEFISTDDNLTIAAGGRYDDLIGMFGEEATPAIGVGIGMERVVLKMISQNISLPKISIIPEVFLIQLGNEAKKKCFKLLHELRGAGLKVSSSLNKKSITSQLKAANKMQARFAVIIGQKEAIDNTIIIRDMKTGVQDVIDWDYSVQEIKNRLG
ncbi:MAG: histidine--tRNA ligase [Patescibacteria group bacterium]